MTTPVDRAAWRCPRCDAERAADDAFCGRCGAPRPGTERPGGGPGPIGAAGPDGVTGSPAAGAGRSTGFPVRRALILNGIVVIAVLAAVVLGSKGGPGAIVFEPATWRCDGTERAWTAPIPARAADLRIEWRTGGPEGELRESSTTTRLELEPYRTPDGTFRVTTTDPTAPECGLAPGRYTMALRDAADNALLASGDVDLAR